MKFCPQCESPMHRDYSTGELGFLCPRCKHPEPASDNDVCIFRMDADQDATKGMYETLKYNAPFVREAHRVKKQCPNCFRDTMVPVRTGVHEDIVYRCECGGTEEVVSTLSAM
jgi:DNA-directed RNA polymerase subunit M/transcription elongation factor TFIIS